SVGVERGRRSAQDAARGHRAAQPRDQRRGGPSRRSRALSRPWRRSERQHARGPAQRARLGDREVAEGDRDREDREAMNLPTDLAVDAKRGYPDLHEHLAELKKRGLLLEIDRAIDKDAELHPLARWQCVCGIDDADRKTLLYTNDVHRRSLMDVIPVVRGASASD